MDFRKAHKGAITAGITVVLDLVDTSVKMYEIAYTYGQIKANFAEYNKNLAILNHITNNGTLSEYTRNAAWDLYNIFESGTTNPNWNEFDRQIQNMASWKL